MTLRKSRRPNLLSRRDIIETAGIAGLAAVAAPTIFVPRHARASQKTLRILQWNHFVPEFDEWFNNVYVEEWGRRNDTRVIVDNVGMTSLKGRAEAEIAAQKGHDLFMFLRPPPSYEDQVIDHRDVHSECRRRYGKPVDLAMKSTYNPKTDKYYGFSDNYVPDPVNYRQDLWADVGVFPDTWENIRLGGAKIKKKHGIPVGIGLASELDTNMALRSIMAAFGSSVQDEAGQPMLDSAATLDALKFARALYRDAMTDEVLAWDASSNNRQMLAGRGSLTLNAISITRTGENQNIPIADRIWLAEAAAGPAGRVGLQHLMGVYVIWKFAENIEGAKRFLVDYVGDARSAFLASQFYNFPCYPDTVPDLGDLIARDQKANPPEKYQIFHNVTDWTTNVGHPGYANAAVDQIFSDWHISTMFAHAASGRLTPGEALKEGSKIVEDIFAEWRSRGKV